MVTTVKKAFTGGTKVPGNRDNYVDAYRDWRAKDHVGATWSFVPLKKDPEVFPSEGYLIKTRGGNDVSTTVPEAYIYAKFSIDGGNDQLTLKTRNFAGTYTFMKLTAVKDDGTVATLDPTFDAGKDVVAGDNGTWKFKHQNGGPNNPDDYLSLRYDLTPFSGGNVTLVFGVYKGEANGDENKLCFYSINLD